MKNLWNKKIANDYIKKYKKKKISKDLALRIYTTHLLGSEKKLVLHGGGNTSLKETQKDILNFVIKNHNPRIDISFQNSKENEGEVDLYIFFDYSLSKNYYLEDIEILNLHNLFNSLLYKVNHMCREINIRKRINELKSLDI